MRANLLTSTAIAAFIAPVAFLNSNAGSKVSISTTNVEEDVDATAAAALTFTPIKGVGDHGEAGTSTNILSYDTWDTKVTQKGKGISDAGSPTLEVARIPTDPGQVALRAAAKTNLNYVFKIERNDKPDLTGTPTIIYNRGIVTGPTRPLGRNEDFDLEVFTLGFNQIEIVVDAAPGA